MNPTRREILDSVQSVRAGNQEHRHTAFARHALRIPVEDMHALRMLVPGLASKDPQEWSAAWEWFERSAFAEPYRVGRLHRGVIRNGNIIV